MKLAVFLIVLAHVADGFPKLKQPYNDFDDGIENMGNYPANPVNMAKSKNQVQNLGITANYFNELNRNEAYRRDVLNLIPIPTFDQYKQRGKGFGYGKMEYKRPMPKLYYYAHPIEALRYEYQPFMRQTYDYEPLIFNPALRRPNHGYGFNEWGGHGIA